MCKYLFFRENNIQCIKEAQKACIDERIMIDGSEFFFGSGVNDVCRFLDSRKRER